MKTRPSTSTTTYDAIVMWSTIRYHPGCPSYVKKEKKNVFENARQSVPEMRKAIKEKNSRSFINRNLPSYEKSNRKKLKKKPRKMSTKYN